MTGSTNKKESTLAYFLEHGTRPYELCCILYRDDIDCVVYIDDEQNYINSISPLLWESKVIGHFYGGLPILQSSEDEMAKSIQDVSVHYIRVKR